MAKRVLIDRILEDRNSEWARRVVRVQMIRRGLTYADLARLLDEAGLHDNERNLRNKVARGEFSAAFMLLCMRVMGAKSIPLDDWDPSDEGLTLDIYRRTDVEI